VPRNSKPNPPRARHSRAVVVAARERKLESRFRRLKNEPLQVYYGCVLSDIKEYACYALPYRERAFRALCEEVGYEAPVIYVHPEIVRRLPLWVREELFLASSLCFGQLADRVHYRDHKRDPWDYSVPLSVLDGYRSREKARWLGEAERELLEGDPEGLLLDAGEAIEDPSAEREEA